MDMLFVISVYWDDKIPLIPKELLAAIEHCDVFGIPFIVFADTNAHHTRWGSKVTKPRGRQLNDFLVTNNIELLNNG